MRLAPFVVIPLLALLLFFPCPIVHAQTPEPSAVVRAVLFYSPTCPHCHYVITETLPPLFEKYGSRLEIVGIDITYTQGQYLFLLALQKFGLENGGVPLLLIGDTYLMGSRDIPEKFPGLIETYLAQGGVDWPNLPGLAEAIAAAQQASSSPTETPSAPVSTVETPAIAPPAPTRTPLPVSLPLVVETPQTPWERWGRDPIGNSVAILVLVGMLVALGLGVAMLFYGKHTPPAWLGKAIPLLAFLGLLVSAYLSYVELTQTEAFCGPVGDCNAVQQSPYARLFGVLPIGVVGLVGYFIIFVLWGLLRWLRQPMVERWAHISLAVLTLAGTLFSIYLTFLEPFVIGATCAWCLLSAILMTLLMLASFWLGREHLRAPFSRANR